MASLESDSDEEFVSAEEGEIEEKEELGLKDISKDKRDQSESDRKIKGEESKIKEKREEEEKETEEETTCKKISEKEK